MSQKILFNRQDADTGRFPCKIGLDVAGTVSAVGDKVSNFKVGDEVYGTLEESDRGSPPHPPYKSSFLTCTGSASDYAVASQTVIAPKNSKLTHAEAASLCIAGITALQVFDKANSTIPGGLKGKTVFVPAGLSGTGSIGLQLAKNVFGAGKVITTVSTAKVDKVSTLLGTGVVDQVVDYKTQDPLKEIPRGSVDFMFDTMGGAISYVSLIKPKAGHIITVATVPNGSAVKKAFPDTPFYFKYVMDLVDWYYRFRTGRWEVGYEYFGVKVKTEDLEEMSKFVAEGKVKPVVGKVAKLDDLQAVKEGCHDIYEGHGGIGKFVIELV